MRRYGAIRPERGAMAAMRRHRRRMAWAACAGGVVTACATTSDQVAGADWVGARVLAISNAAALGPQADRRCVDAVAHDDDSTIVVVRRRSARLARDHAFVVSVPAALRVGDLVDVDLQRCLLKPRAAEDLQRIANPGYNADRGPAAFIGARLHVEL